MLGFGIVGIISLFSVCHDSVPFLRNSDSDEEYVTFLESDVVLLGDFKNILETDLMRRERAILDPLLFGPCQIVNQYSTTCPDILSIRDLSGLSIVQI